MNKQTLDTIHHISNNLSMDQYINSFTVPYSITEKEKLSIQLILNGLLNTLREYYPQYKDLNFTLHYKSLKSDLNSIASTLPDGNIVVGKRMLELLKINDTKPLVALILAHEISHVLASHAAKDEIYTTLKESTHSLLEIDNEVSEMLIEKSNKSLDRHQELEADTLGYELIKLCGYDTNKAATQIYNYAQAVKSSSSNWYTEFLENRNNPYVQKAQAIENSISTHPSIDRRVKSMLSSNLENNCSDQKVDFGFDKYDIYSEKLNTILKRHNLAFGTIYKDGNTIQAVVVDVRNDALYKVSLSKDNDFSNLVQSSLGDFVNKSNYTLITNEKVMKEIHFMFDKKNLSNDDISTIYQRLSPSARSDLEQLSLEIMENNTFPSTKYYIESVNIEKVEELQVYPDVELSYDSLYGILDNCEYNSDELCKTTDMVNIIGDSYLDGSYR